MLLNWAENESFCFKTLVCMYAGDLQDQCKVVSAYEFALHSSSDNDLTKLGG
ncbi:hypothetical protein Tsp_01378 [Trichinella spiralis]|uniref:hypothetical protein n=1 Tax=Trichinella spiralis TaxID=6334 RepID=UPI0001EFB2C8|nr:hypothetical protein Tsp_01378 [Trichinella spiralis]